MKDWWWRLRHIYVWRFLATVAGAIYVQLRNWHDGLHPVFDPDCKFCREADGWGDS